MRNRVRLKGVEGGGVGAGGGALVVSRARWGDGWWGGEDSQQAACDLPGGVVALQPEKLTACFDVRCIEEMPCRAIGPVFRTGSRALIDGV